MLLYCVCTRSSRKCGIQWYLGDEVADCRARTCTHIYVCIYIFIYIVLALSVIEFETSDPKYKFLQV